MNKLKIDWRFIRIFLAMIGFFVAIKFIALPHISIVQFAFDMGLSLVGVMAVLVLWWFIFGRNRRKT